MTCILDSHRVSDVTAATFTVPETPPQRMKCECSASNFVYGILQTSTKDFEFVTQNGNGWNQNHQCTQPQLV